MILIKYILRTNPLKYGLLIGVISLLFACDDGNQDSPPFKFDSTVSSCGDLTLFKIKDKESIALVINADNTDNVFLNQIRDQEEVSVSEISYRTFESSPTSSYYCQSIPPASPLLIEEWIGTGQLTINTEFEQADTDGIIELDLILNSDGDAFPDYIDSDDDNDGILSKDELDEDSDGDGVKNYLDDDDDNDGVPTANESINADIDGDGIVDYLDADTTVDNGARSIGNSYVQTFKNEFTIDLLKLENSKGNALLIDTYSFGTKTTTKTMID